MPDSKKVSAQALFGEEGINFVQKHVLAMGFVWNQRGQVEAGIDGTIELRDETGVVLNSIIQVQSKATRDRFQAETQGSLEYTCDERDLDYWLRGNTPIILVLSRPSTNEGYWVSIKDYFHDPVRRKARKVHFDKKTNRFDPNARAALFDLGVSRDSGLYLGPMPRAERVHSNLVPITRFAARIHLADTEYTDRHLLRERLRQLGKGGDEWILRSKRILSFHDLDDHPWNRICDVGTSEAFASREWADSEDADRQRDFVALLNRCLRERTRALGLRYDGARDHYFFPRLGSRPRYTVEYESLAKKSRRTVFGEYRSRTTKKVSYCRHMAFRGIFRRYEFAWFLEIVPTYHYTSDGDRPDRWAADRLSGIKKLERNPAVLHQVLFWAEYLRGSRCRSLFVPEYGLLSFGPLLSFEADSGLSDAEWLQREEDEATKQAAEFVDEPSLFDP